MDLLEMKYESYIKEKPKLLYTDTYKGYEYYITSMGSHPCAYIVIEPDDKLYGKSCDELSDIPVHGGVTYAETYLSDWVTDKWVIGWDYWHGDDYNGINGEMLMTRFERDLKKWTTKEIQVEIMDLIDYIKMCK